MVRPVVLGVLTFLTGAIAGAAVLATGTDAGPRRSANGDGAPATSAAHIDVASVFLRASESGPAAALGRLDTIAQRDSSVASRGHALAHAVGRFAVAARNYDPGVIAECTPQFQSGCYHGVVHAYLEKHGAVSEEVIRSMCSPLRERVTGALSVLECAHGVGHGLNAALDHDLFRALDWCDTLPGDEPDWCFSGAFMENLANAGAEHFAADQRGEMAPAIHHHSHHGAAPTAQAARHEHVRATDPYFPCSAVERRYQTECWKYQSVVSMILTRNDFRATIDFCARAPAEWMIPCFEGIGTQAAGLHPSDPDASLAICARAEGAQYTACARGAADYLFALNLRAKDAFALCARAIATAQPACYERIGSRLARAHPTPNAVARICAEAGEKGEPACLRGAKYRKDYG